MRILGFLFLIVLVLALVGWFRGWFTVTTVHAGNGLTVQVDNDKLRDDSRTAADTIASTSEKIAAVVKSFGDRTTGAESSVLHGTITAIDMIERDITVRVDTTSGTATSSMVRLRVPRSITVTQKGTNVDFEQARLGSRVKLTFVDDGGDQRLSRVEVMS